VTLSAVVGGAGVGAGDNIVFASIPLFTTASGSSVISVELLNHGITAPGGSVDFAISTTGNGVTIFGHYIVVAVADANNFTIQGNAAASASGSFPMNGGNAEIIYNIALGPSQPGVGYGLGNYGAGAYGFGTGSSSSQTGTPITATSENSPLARNATSTSCGCTFFPPVIITASRRPNTSKCPRPSQRPRSSVQKIFSARTLEP
jgi:hypothetical protein